MNRAFKMIHWTVCAMLLSLSLAPRADAAAEKSPVEIFCDRVGQVAYLIAWPSATYRGWEYVGLTRDAGEVDLTIRLEGSSAWDGSDLWTDATFVLRADESMALRFGANNALLVPPGATVDNISAALNDQLDRTHHDATRP